jgi:hypothetical protein
MSDRHVRETPTLSKGPRIPLEPKPLPPSYPFVKAIEMGAILSLIGLAAVLFVVAGLLHAAGIPVAAVAHTALQFVGRHIAWPTG